MVLFYMRKRMQKYEHIFTQRCAIADTLFWVSMLHQSFIAWFVLFVFKCIVYLKHLMSFRVRCPIGTMFTLRKIYIHTQTIELHCQNVIEVVMLMTCCMHTLKDIYRCIRGIGKILIV